MKSELLNLSLLNEWAETCYQSSVNKGFYEDQPPANLSKEEAEKEGLDFNDVEERWNQWNKAYIGNKIMLMVGELAEAHEGLRHNNPPSEHIPEFSALEEEMADTIIRILDFCGYQKLRIAEALAAKFEYNQTRPHKHGKQF